MLKNAQGTEVHVLPRGATLQRILLGNVDVVLGVDTEEPYRVGGWEAAPAPCPFEGQLPPRH